MRTLILLSRFLFSPNPSAVAHYSDPAIAGLLALSVAFILLWIVLKLLRKRMQTMTRKLTASWPGAALAFGLIGCVLVVARVEKIQFIAMPFLWVVWFGALLVFVFLQVRLFTARHYQVMPRDVVLDPRDRYLPGKKR